MYKKIVLLICFAFTSFSGAFATENETYDLTYPTGTVLQSATEKYTVVDKLGEGAFGCVYMAENEEGKRFAIKSYKGDLMDHMFSDPEREYQRGLQLDHPNIIKAYDLFNFVLPNQGETTNLVLEFVEGQTIYHTERGQYNREQSLLALDQFLNAIEYSMASGYIHLDLHGNNVMLDKEGNLKVIDLGSFLDQKEVIDYVKKRFISKVSSTKNSTQSKSNTPVAKGLIQHVAKEKSSDKNVEAFFKKHPEMLEKLVNDFAHEVQKVEQSVKNVAAKSLYRPASQSAENIAEKRALSKLHSYYLHYVSELCLEILMKTNFDREEKISILTEIKKISWNCDEDLYDGVSLPVESYISEIHDLVGTATTSR